MANTRCEQDLVGFNPQNSGAVLQIGITTLVNDALVIDTTATPTYTGVVQLSIGNELGMTAVFAESGTTALTKTVIAGQILYIPLRVTATDCGYDRCGYWQFTVYYEADPNYGDNTGGEDPDPCNKPNRNLKVCRFDARWPNKCYAKFDTPLINVSGEGQLITRFSLGQSPQCTGPVKIMFATECVGLSFSAEQRGAIPPDVTCDPIIRREPEVVLGNGDINSPIYIDVLNEVWVSDSVNDEIQRFDATTYAILPPVALTPGDAPVGLFYFGGGLDKVYVALSATNDVAIIDINTLTVTAITGAVGTAPSRFTWVTEPGVSEAWVTCFGSDNVYRIDVMTDTVVGGAISVQTQPNDILFTGNGKVYVASQSSSLYVINTTTYGAGAVSGASSVFRMALSGSVIYARANGIVYRVNSNTATVTNSFAVAGDGGLAHMPGNGFFILDKNTDSMFLYNEDTAPVLLNTYTTGQTPLELIIEPTVGRLFVTNTATGDVTPYTTRACANPIFELVTSQNLEVTLPYSYALDYVDVTIDYNTEDISCFCDIKATVEYESCNNPNLFTNFNNGTMSGYVTQAQFNTFGILARNSTVFSFTINPVAGTALRSTIDSPVDYTNRPLPNAPTNPNALAGSIIWQGDTTTAIPTTGGERYWLKCKSRMLPALPLIRANEEVHLDRYFVTGSGAFNPAIPYFTQYTPTNQWHDIGIRWQSNPGATITPFVRYVNTFASFPNTQLVGDLQLNDGASSDWANVELTKYYPADCIECPAKYLTIKNQGCDYETILDLSFAEGQECVTIQLNDNSLFGYTPGHSQSDFNLYRKVTVTLPDGNQQFLSSVVPYDILINPASVNPLTPFTTFPVTQGGFYEFTMCNVPTFRTDISYQVDDCVCLLDGTGALRFFQCIQTRSGITPLVTAGWQNYWVEVTEDSLDEKYCDTQTYSNFCFLDACIDEYRNRLYCSIKNFCNVNICENECIQNYLYLISVKRFLQNGPPFENPRDVLNYLKKLCSTCNCQ